MLFSDLYCQVTSRFIAQIEQGTWPWLRPWAARSDAIPPLIPRNYCTGRAYDGINIPILWDATATYGYDTHLWLTRSQAETIGVKVRRRQRGTNVVFFRSGKNDEHTCGSPTTSALCTSLVFNVAQMDGLQRSSIPTVGLPWEQRYTRVQDFIYATKAVINYGGVDSGFVSSVDFINLPLQLMFKSPASFYATTLHELAHWSGHKSRLNRDLSKRFACRSYAAEELVAEFTSAFLCAYLGIESELRHADYIDHWLALLRDDASAIFTTTSMASQATDYLRLISKCCHGEK